MVFILVSFFGMRSSWGNIGHDAHLGGAIIGLLTATALQPRIVGESPLLYGAVMGISAVLLLFTYWYPLHANPARRANWREIKEQLKYKSAVKKQQDEQQTLERLLEKVSRQGIHSLTEAERKQLQAISERRKNFDKKGMTE